ncbi:MAG: LytTR family DNA-binding domain-containing protein [Flavobacteriaceae bacterium]|nr:LytTR family DNA-binding domain-containing protein [Flavobacteriaceae bacterium]
MRSVIIDDEEMARSIIEQLISKNKDLSLVDIFSNTIDAIKYLNQNTIDLIFLDIHMPTFTGFELLQTLKKQPKVILTTSDKNLALEAFEYDCIVDYLVKPVTQERFDKAVQKAMLFAQTNKMEKKANDNEVVNELYVNIDRRLVKINFATIILIEAKGDYILIKTDTKNYTVNSTMKKIEEKLPEMFLKVHRSFIINTTKIIDIEDNSVLIGNNVIPVSRSNRPELMKRLNLL